MSIQTEILALDSIGALTRLKSTLAELDTAAQKLAPTIGMLRYQIAKSGGSIQDATKGLPPESLAASTLRNCKVYENVFKEQVLAGNLTESQFMALSFGACHDLMAAHKLASTAAKKGGASNLALAEKMASALKSGKPAKEVLKSLKASTAAKPILATIAEKETEREAKLEADKKQRESDKAAFDAWNAKGRPELPDLSQAAKLAAFIMDTINAMKPKQRAVMPDMLRGIADRLDTNASDAAPTNIVELSKAA